MTARGTTQNPNFINCNPLTIMQKLYEIKARQDGSGLKVIVREITPGAARPANRKEKHNAGLQL